MTVDHVRVNSVTNLRTVVLKEKESTGICLSGLGSGRGRHSDEAGGTGDARPMTHRIMDTMIRDLGER